MAWIYTAETTIDAALGMCLFTLWFTVTWLVLVCPPLMSEDSIGPTNVFWLFSGISFVATIYVWFFIKESKGLTEREKKLLYTPKHLIEDIDKAASDM